MFHRPCQGVSNHHVPIPVKFVHVKFLRVPAAVIQLPKRTSTKRMISGQPRKVIHNGRKATCKMVNLRRSSSTTKRVQANGDPTPNWSQKQTNLLNRNKMLHVLPPTSCTIHYSHCCFSLVLTLPNRNKFSLRHLNKIKISIKVHFLISLLRFL